ncbi:MAG TPA: acyl-CoA dehydrogenase family protein [Stellaceae bacterium]|nr:acyl-CoA dehydrogenase family protein [Stellaceae bacterium]
MADAVAGSLGNAAPYVDAARALAPRIRELRQDIERQRTLPAELVERMTDARLFSLWRCRAFGGPELTFAEFAHVIEELSRVDGSVGWCAMISAVFHRLSGYVSDEIGREVFGDRSRIAGSVNPTGRAVAVPGGYRVSGRWSYGSFIQHSHWTLGNSIIYDGDAPRRDANGAPDIRFMIMPTADVEIIDIWHVAGLRGTGSNDFQVADVFVPEERSVPAFTTTPLQPGPLYATPMITIFAASLPCVSIGIARGAIDAFTALAEGKTPMGSSVRLREKPMAQADLGRAEAHLRAGRAFLFEAIGEIWDEAAAGRALTMRQRAVARLAAAKAADASAQAVDLLFNAAGGTALFESTPLERCFRDVHATTQHIGTQPANYELAGRVLLGLDPGTPRF